MKPWTVSTTANARIPTALGAIVSCVQVFSVAGWFVLLLSVLLLWQVMELVRVEANASVHPAGQVQLVNVLRAASRVYRQMGYRVLSNKVLSKSIIYFLKKMCNNKGTCICGLCKCTIKDFRGRTCERCVVCSKIMFKDVCKITVASYILNRLVEQNAKNCVCVSCALVSILANWMPLSAIHNVIMKWILLKIIHVHTFYDVSLKL